MSEIEIDSRRVREEIRPVVEAFARDAVASLRHALSSAHLVGSAVTPDFDPRTSDVNFLLVFREIRREELDDLARLGSIHGPRGVAAPLSMTEEYVVRSLDVFPIEFLSLSRFHVTLWGVDPLAGLAIDRKALRLQCERELKGNLQQLRQAYVSDGRDPRRLQDLLGAAHRTYVPIVRGLVYLSGGEPPASAAEATSAAERALGVDLEVLRDLEKLRRGGRREGPDALRALFGRLYALADDLSRRVDRMEVSS